MRRNRSRLRFLILHGLHVLVGAAFVFWGDSAFAQAAEDAVPGAECCLSMLYPIGARTVALGQALTARGGKDAIFINPASLADLTSEEIIVHRSTIGEDPMTTITLVIHSRVAGVIAFTYRIIDYAKDIATDDFGNPVGETTTLDQVLVASYATTFAKSWGAGLNYRLYNFSSQCSGFCAGESQSGTTPMLDAGVRYTPSWLPNLKLGAAIMHVGLKLQVKNAEQADATPARLRVGAAYQASRFITKDTTTAVWVHVDAVERLKNAGTPGINVGVEVVLDNTIFFRVGHASAADGVSFGGNAVGLGLKYQRFDISVAKSVTPSPLFEDPVYVTFGVTF